MKTYFRSKKIAFLAISSVFFASCSDKELYDANAVKSNTHNVESNTFNFSTVQQVNLTVDYSAFKTYGQVFFSVYSENPFAGEGEDERLDESIRPVFEDFTDASGKFSRQIELPAFATRLFVVTGNFFVTERMMEVEVVDGAASAVAVNNSFATRAGVTRANGEGVSTNDLSTMPHLSCLVDESGNLVKDQEGNNIHIYKDWLTPLGTWNSSTGRPDYILKPGDVPESLLCSQEDIEGLFSAVGQALDENRPCSEVYRNHPDLTLEKNSQVTITMLGGSTCWNSTLGYYYYLPNDEPQKPEDLNIIMLFPNTQDGQWKKSGNHNYNNNIGVNRGDAVLLKYYPHIGEEGSDEYRLSEETTEFPAGIKIGFILKAHGWGMQGNEYTITNFTDRNRKYNVWGASTNKTSYCKPFGQEGVAPYQYCNPYGESRTAKFAYKKVNGDKTEKFAIVSFEDACNDQDYDDVIFALKPVNSFTPLPEIEDKVTTTVGIYAFEDLWPSRGDYDLNDVVVDFKHQKFMSRQNKTEDFKIYKETFSLTTYQNYVELVSGLALRLVTKDSPAPSSIVVKKMDKNSGEAVVVENPTIVDNNYYYLTSNVTAELGSTYILELYYDNGVTASNAKVEPFIYREEESGKTWEVHIPYEAPSPRFRLGYFGTDDDASDANSGRYFVRNVESGYFPFAFFLYEARIEKFMETILVRKNESKRIDTFFDGYENWAVTKGDKNKDWYMHPKQ